MGKAGNTGFQFRTLDQMTVTTLTNFDKTIFADNKPIV